MSYQHFINMGFGSPMHPYMLSPLQIAQLTSQPGSANHPNPMMNTTTTTAQQSSQGGKESEQNLTGNNEMQNFMQNMNSANTSQATNLTHSSESGQTQPYNLATNANNMPTSTNAQNMNANFYNASAMNMGMNNQLQTLRNMQNFSDTPNQNKTTSGHMPQNYNTPPHVIVHTVTASGSQKRKLNTDPNRPKRPTSAYFYFVQLEREEAAKRGERITKVAEWTKQASVKWRALTDEEKAQFQTMAAGDKERYSQEMAVYTGKDSNKPKRPQSAYFLWLADFRVRMKDKILEHKEILKAAGEEWRKLTMEEKAPYEQLAEEERKKYDTRMREYQATIKKAKVEIPASQEGQNSGRNTPASVSEQSKQPPPAFSQASSALSAQQQQQQTIEYQQQQLRFLQQQQMFLKQQQSAFLQQQLMNANQMAGSGACGNAQQSGHGASGTSEDDDDDDDDEDEDDE